MSEVFDIYTLLFLVLAVVIFLRLRNVLGRRTGNERPPYDPYSTSESRVGTAKQSDTVVNLPRPGSSAPSPEPPAPSAADIEARLEDYAPKDSPLAKSLTALMQADPSFDPRSFLDGAKVAYEMVVMGYAEGDEQVLRQLLSDDVFESFKKTIAARKEKGETAETTLVGISKADIIEAEVKNATANVTVRFGAELISVVRDAAGKIIEGNPETVRDVSDIWTFSRDVASRNPNWKLVATQTAN
jgi:predicted lipid-binding transport protein (Tim44 family)